MNTHRTLHEWAGRGPNDGSDESNIITELLLPGIDGLRRRLLADVVLPGAQNHRDVIVQAREDAVEICELLLPLRVPREGVHLVPNNISHNRNQSNCIKKMSLSDVRP